MKEQNARHGTFSSSEIYKLVKTGRAKDANFYQTGLTYIQDKRFEQKLGKSLTGETSAKPTNWGKFMEIRVFDLIDLSYRLDSERRLGHPTIKEWTGAPDTLRGEFVGDIKCPWTLKSFCEAIDALEESTEKFKEVKPEWYWQLVSNAILTGKDKAEIIIYVPYLSELEEIREMANNYDGDQNKIAFINWSEDEDLPHLLDGGEYKNINIFEFDVPQEDVDFLTERVEDAIKLLKA